MISAGSLVLAPGAALLPGRPGPAALAGGGGGPGGEGGPELTLVHGKVGPGGRAALIVRARDARFAEAVAAWLAFVLESG